MLDHMNARHFADANLRLFLELKPRVSQLEEAQDRMALVLVHGGEHLSHRARVEVALEVHYVFLVHYRRIEDFVQVRLVGHSVGLVVGELAVGKGEDDDDWDDTADLVQQMALQSNLIRVRVDDGRVQVEALIHACAHR